MTVQRATAATSFGYSLGVNIARQNISVEVLGKDYPALGTV